MPLNADLLQRRSEEIAQSLERLEQMRGISPERFLADQDTRDIACYRLLLAIEAAIQICYHISANRLQRVPEQYAGCFALLSEAGLLSPDLSQRLQRMARFRNMLVHVYWDVDYIRVYDIVQDHLSDLRDFVGAVSELL